MQAGSRLSPAAGRIEVESSFPERLTESELSSEAFGDASEYATKEFAKRGRIGWDPAVMKIHLSGLDEPILVFDRQSPEGRPGLAFFRHVTCGCRRGYLLQVLALVSAGIQAAGIIPADTHVPVMRVLPFGQRRTPNESAYSVRDGRLIVDPHGR